MNIHEFVSDLTVDEIVYLIYRNNNSNSNSNLEIN